MLPGGGRIWSHLSQVLLRLDVPAELIAARRGVSRPTSAAGWATLRDHVELADYAQALESSLAELFELAA